MEGPKQETRTTQRSDPYGPAVPYVGGLLSSLGSAYGIPSSGSPGGMLGGSSATNALMGSAGTDRLPAGKQALLNGGTGGQQFNIGLSPAENAAYDALIGNTANANRYAPETGQLASDLFRGGPDRTGAVQSNLDQYRAQLAPYQTMDTNPYSNEAFTRFAGGLTSDIQDSLKSQYAGAGYSPVRSGDYGGQLAEKTAKGLAPTWAQAYFQNEAIKRGAQDAGYGAGNTTAGLLSGLDTTALNRRLAAPGIGQAALAAENAPYLQQIALENQRWGVPAQRGATLAAPFFTAAQLGGTQNGTQTTQTQIPMGQQLLGLGLAGAGLASGLGAFGPAAGMGGGLLAGMNPFSSAGQMFGSGINTGVMGGGYLGPGGQLYPGPGWIG